MKMIEVKTADLVGAALDWAAAWAEGDKVSAEDGYVVVSEFNEQHGDFFNVCYSPSTDWAQGGPLIEKSKAQVLPNSFPGGLPWLCWIKKEGMARPLDMHGETPLIAICRAIVAAKLGDKVSVPAELLTSS